MTGLPALLSLAAGLPSWNKVIAIAKLDRLARDAAFESRRISERTVEAKAVAKANGYSFGGRREAAVAAAHVRKGEAVK